MSPDNSMSVRELVDGLRDHGQRLPFEIGAFVALETCEALVRRPAVVSPDNVVVGEAGAVSVRASTAGADSASAAKAVTSLLAHLLVAAGAGVPSRLVNLVESAEQASGDLSSLRDQLEAALIPLNRDASQRVLSRMLREVRRPGADRPRAMTPDLQRADDDLDALLGGAPPEPDLELDSLLGEGAKPAVAPPPAMSPPVARSAVQRQPSEPPPAVHARGAWAETPDGRRVTAPPHALDVEDAAARKAPWLWAVFFGALIGALILAVVWFRPDAIERLSGHSREDALATERALAEERNHEQRLEEHRSKFGEIVIHVAPERAQVLLFVGRAPTEARDLPMGRVHEFVALSDDGGVARGLVPANAEWSDDSRYELALQTAAPAHAGDVGESTLPQDMGQDRGTLGTVRVITNPPGTRVHQLVGFAPEVRIANAERDRSYELIITASRHRTERVVIGPSDWLVQDGHAKAEVSVDLARLE